MGAEALVVYVHIEQNVLGTENEGAEVLLTGLDIERGLFGAGALGYIELYQIKLYLFNHNKT